MSVWSLLVLKIFIIFFFHDDKQKNWKARSKVNNVNKMTYILSCNLLF